MEIVGNIIKIRASTTVKKTREHEEIWFTHNHCVKFICLNAIKYTELASASVGFNHIIATTYYQVYIFSVIQKVFFLLFRSNTPYNWELPYGLVGYYYDST
jgi:hypothetical protein